MATLDLSNVDKPECTSFDCLRYDYHQLSPVTAHHPRKYISFEGLIKTCYAAGRLKG
jgi:hypothetical protein